MKARVKETGEIVEVEPAGMTGYYYLKNHDYKKWAGCDLDFNYYKPDYWARLEHQYAGMAMQGLMTILPNIGRLEGRTPKDEIVDIAMETAHALVGKMKEKEERK